MKTKGMLWVSIVTVGLLAPVLYGWSYNPEPFTIASEGGGGMRTQMAGNYVVWQDTMGMQWYGYDLAAREPFTIAGGGVMTLLANESYAVWQDSMAMSWYGYELAERRKFALSISDIDGMNLRLTGRFLIFKGTMDMTLHGMDLESGEVLDIASGDIDGFSVRAAGDYVIWRTMTTPTMLAGYKLSAQQGFVLSSGEVDSMSVAMSDQFVAWREMGTSEPMQGGLYGFDLAQQGEKFLITTADIDSMSVEAAGRYIVWRSMTNNTLYGVDCVSGENFDLGENIDSMNLLVNEGYAVWKDMTNMHLYGFDLAARRLIEMDVETMYSATLSGCYVFWSFSDPALMTNELRGFDMATNTSFTVASLSSAGTMAPIAEGDYVLWTDMIPPSADTQLLGARIWKVPNDGCEDAVEVIAETAYMGDTSGALGVDQTDCGAGDWRDTWHEFRPPVGGEYTIDAHSDAFDPTLAVFAACTGGATACNDDANIQTTDSRLVMTLVKGKRYLIRVAGVDGSGGPYELTISRGSCTAPPQADVTGDCKVNLADLAVLSSQWLDCGLNPADLCI
jgi:hypothetical protein